MLGSVLQLYLETCTLVQEKYLQKHVPRSKLMTGEFSSPHQPQVHPTIQDPADTLSVLTEAPSQMPTASPAVKGKGTGHEHQ